MELQEILRLDQLAKEDGRRYARKRTPSYQRLISSLGRHFTGIVGPRGSGKTVILKQMAVQQEGACYLSLDSLGELNLFETAKTLVEKYHFKILLLDEIHYHKHFEGELKKMFDFLSVRVVFTSSIALAIAESAHDLSRRVRLITLYPFSFREYLLFAKGVELPSLTIDDILHRRWTNEHLQWGHAFEGYLKGELYPFSLEEPDVLPLLKNVLEKIIRRDVPLIMRLATDEIDTIEKVAAFIGRSPVDGINFSSVAKNVGITKYKAEQYIQLLAKSFVLNPLFPHGTNVLQEPKVLMCVPYRLLFKPYDEAIGALREDFVAEAMAMSGSELHYLKSTRGMKTPDFLLQKDGGELVIEVGGKGKGRTQFRDFSAKEKVRLTDSVDVDGDRRPLFLLGYLV